MKIVLATGNAGKAAEISVALRGVAGLELLPRPADVPEPAEDGDSLVDNARIKAMALVAA